MAKVLSAFRNWRLWPAEVKLAAFGAIAVLVLIFEMFLRGIAPAQDYQPYPYAPKPPYTIRPYYPQQERSVPRPRPDLDTEFLIYGGRPTRPGTCVFYNYAGQPILRPCF